MKNTIKNWRRFLTEREDSGYFQETFELYALLSVSKDLGGNRDQIKNDIRALPEVLTVSVVDPPRGIQRNLPTRFLTTLKIHCRQPAIDANQLGIAKRILQAARNMRGVKVIKYDLPQAFAPEDALAEGYQQDPDRLQRLSRGFDRLTKTGPNKSGPFHAMETDPDWKSAPPGAPGGLEEGCGCPDMDPPSSGKIIKIKIKSAGGKIVDSFHMHDELSAAIWAGDKMRPEIRDRLEEIAQEFIDNLELPNLRIKDIILTGSLANFNWSSFSDLDVHIVVDFRDISEDEGFVKKYFDAVRSNWNRSHEILVKDYEVELYIQDDDEEHVSTGVYSILNDEWVVAPSKKEEDINTHSIMKKALPLMREVERIELLSARGDVHKALDLGNKLKEKLRRLRSSGLESEGIFSVENLAFKVLRRSGHMGRLYDIMRETYDTERSIADQ